MLFLLAVFLFAILFIIIYRPAGDMFIMEEFTRFSPHIYTAIQVFSGFILISLSRFILYKVQQRKTLNMEQILVWFVLELVLIILALTLIAYILNTHKELNYFDLLLRVAVNTVAIVLIPYVVTVLLFSLREKHKQVEELQKLIEQKPITPPQSNDNINFYDKGGKLAFSTRCKDVLYIEAADNYSNIHYLNEGKEETFILHNSMKELENRELYPTLLRCQRGYIVNIENVKLLRKEKDVLMIELNQGGKSIPVSKTYNEKVVRFFTGNVAE